MDALITPDIFFKISQGVGQVTFNRATSLNALTLSMVRQMHQCLLLWADDPNVKLVIVTGAGDKAFCAGGDVCKLYESVISGRNEHNLFFQEEFALDEDIYTYPKPFISLMDGYVMGGGMGISQGATYRIVTERSKLSMPEVAIGYFPDVGASYFLSRCPDSIGNYLGLTGKAIHCDDALYSNLADWVLASNKINNFILELESLASLDGIPTQIENILRNLGAYSKASNAPLSVIHNEIHFCFSHKTVEDVLNSLVSLEKTCCEVWLKDALILMRKNSPIAMEVTQKLLSLGRNLSIQECFSMELTLAKQWMYSGDFIEGVRARLIDKDNSPSWRLQFTDISKATMRSIFPQLYN